MAKVKLQIQKNPKGSNLYIVNVHESISKSKEVIVYADYYIITDTDDIIFVNENESGQDFIFSINSSYWKYVNKYEKVDVHLKSISFHTLIEHLEMLELKELEEQIKMEELEKETIETEIKTEELKESIKEEK